MDHHHSPKKAKIAADDVVFVTIDQLDDVLADIFGWLRVQEIMGKRCVCKKWKEAAKKTIVPPTVFRVECVENYNAVEVMTTELPNLQQIKIGYLGEGEKYSEGEDPNEGWAAYTANRTSYDIGIISNFSKLRELRIFNAGLNGRYPALFNFPFLQKLSIVDCAFLKWDLEMLAGFPLLKELYCVMNRHLTGNINSLRGFKDTLEKVKMDRCDNVEGNLMDLADFPHLKELELFDAAVTGDIRDIGRNDFSALEFLRLPKSVYGATNSELQRISDAPDLARALNLLKKKIPALDLKYWYGKLSEDSPDWYDSADEDREETPPFYIQFVEVGSRLGYRWYGNLRNVCEINWLDPEPDNRDSSEKAEYTEKLQLLERQSRISLYGGFHQPPTEMEYYRLVEDNLPI